MIPTLLTAWHMGALHPYEQALVLLLAFGPFVVLGVVVWLRSREEHREHAAPEESTGPTPEDPLRTP